MRISELYPAIQGETRHAGRPCALVRLAGCDLRCSYCDTAYARSGGTEMAADAVLAEIERLRLPLVLLTGGEPLLQPETPALAGALLARGYEVMVETSGAHPVAVLPPQVIKIVDAKTPGSGEAARNRWEDLALLGPRDAVKFVLTSEDDYRWALQVIERHGLGREVEVLLSPAVGCVAAQDLAAWMLRDRVPARLNLQLHRILWPDAERGV